jgi:hypothetical protein
MDGVVTDTFENETSKGSFRTLMKPIHSTAARVYKPSRANTDKQRVAVFLEHINPLR